MSSGQPSVANGQSADENHVSSTSVSRSSSPEPHSAHAAGLVSCTVTWPSGQYQTGQLVAPPELPRDAPVGRVLERVDREAVLALGVEARPRARAAPRAAAA